MWLIHFLSSFFYGRYFLARQSSKKDPSAAKTKRRVRVVLFPLWDPRRPMRARAYSLLCLFLFVSQGIFGFRSKASEEEQKEVKETPSAELVPTHYEKVRTAHARGGGSVVCSRVFFRGR